MSNKKRLEEITKHHIIPKSRGSRKSRRNIAMVPYGTHQAYHELFENRTPIEIVQYLNKTFWNGRYKPTL